MSGRTFSFVVLSSLVLALPSKLDIVMADNRLPVAAYVCHDGVWGITEYCGRDAWVTTGVPELNHDCIVDGIDVGMFVEQMGMTAPGLSADLDGNGTVSELMDVLFFAPRYGDHPTGCIGQTPSTCQGTIALSFDPNPANIVSTAVQAPGTHTVYVVVDGYADARYVEYAIFNSANMIITDNTRLVPGANGLPSCNTGAFNDVIACSPALGSGPVVIAEIEYNLLDTNPATLTIKSGNCQWSRVRWIKAEANISYDFANVSNAGINGAAPAPTPCSSSTSTPIGTVAGKVYTDYDGDCSFDVGTDIPNDHIVRLDPGPYLALPDANGNYTIDAPAGTYTASLHPSAGDPADIQDCQTSTLTVIVPPNGTITGVDIALYPVGMITGRVYRNNIPPGCGYDNGFDFPLVNRTIVAGGYKALTDATGSYEMVLPVGQYTVSLMPVAGDPFVFEFCQVSTYSEVVEHDILPDRDFSLHQSGPAHCGTSLKIIPNGFNVGPPPCNGRILPDPCPGIEYEYIFLVSMDIISTYPAPIGSTLDITLDTEFTINSVTSDWPITVLSSSGANQKTLQFDDYLWPGQIVAVKVRATPSSGGPYHTEAVFDEGGLCGGQQMAFNDRKSGCSCDPNDLAVEPEGCGDDHEIVGNETMTYTIRFENVGPGPAHDIRIEHQLDGDLDMSSLRVVASSHDVTAVQLDPNELAVIRLDGIELPGTFGPGSNKGYVIVTVDPLPALPNGTIISSSAAITFDFNDPVITNTVTRKVMADPCGPTGVDDSGIPLKDYLGANFPNPFNPVTTIEYGLAASGDVSISIYNVAGERVRTLVSGSKPAGRYTVEWNGRDEAGSPVASGVYLSRMTAGTFSEVRKLVLLK